MKRQHYYCSSFTLYFRNTFGRNPQNTGLWKRFWFLKKDHTATPQGNSALAFGKKPLIILRETQTNILKRCY